MVGKSVAFIWILGVFGICSLFFIGCSGEDEAAVQKKLAVICKDDLHAIVDSLPAESLIGKPYYSLVFYKMYDEADYSRKAIADFYFFKKVHVKIVRKYRYHRSRRMWDRYSNEYVFLPDTTISAPKK